MWLACKWVAVWVGFEGTEIDQTRAKNISLANKNQMPVNFLSSFISPAKQGAGKPKETKAFFMLWSTTPTLTYALESEAWSLAVLTRH